MSNSIVSEWDADTLSVELDNVRIKADTAVEAWRDITSQYLLRANLYVDVIEASENTPFTFVRDHATGKEIFDAFVTAYPTLTYTQSRDTAIIWVYPKRMNYSEILSQRISVVNHGEDQVPMYTGVYLPLCNLLRSNIVDSEEAPRSMDMLADISTRKPPFPYNWLFDVNLPVGVYTAREILDMCCVANPSKAFLVQPLPKQQKPLVIFRDNLVFGNPFSPPRARAVKYWEAKIGNPTNGIPTLEEIRAAMSDPDPKKRSAASLYVESCPDNYAPIGLIGKARSSDEAVWTALGEEYAEWREADTNYLTSLILRIPRLREDLKNIRNPCLALLASLQLSREGRDTSYLDSIINKHKYSDDEIASVKPELTRMARSSKTVRDKLLAIKSQVRDLSPETLSELADTNSFLVLPQGSK